MTTKIERQFVGFEQRWCSGYGTGPDQPEFHVCRDRYGPERYSIHQMRRYTDMLGRATYGLQLIGFAPTLKSAQTLIDRRQPMWNHSLCDSCWIVLEGNREPVRLRAVVPERCCRCGVKHASGIYQRQDPSSYPCQGNH